jgi:polysaccharide chain length determinant protein (PEP-CTERM system associated)
LRYKHQEIQLDPLQQVLIYGREIYKRRWYIALGTLALTLVLFPLIAMIPDTYSATTVILVDPQKIPERYVAATVSSDPVQRLNTITQEILSVTRLQEIITQMGLYSELTGKMSREEIIDLMRKDITIQVKQGASSGLSSFSISYEGRDPKVVAQVTNQLALSFINGNLKTREQQAMGTTEFLTSQMEDARRDLEQQEHKISDFKLAHVGEMPEQQGANLQMIAQLRVSLQGNIDQLNRLDIEKNVLLHSGDGAAAGAGAKPQPVTERGRLERDKHELEAQLYDASRKYTPQHPEVVDLKGKLEVVLSRLKALPPDAEPAADDPHPENLRLQVINREIKRLTSEQQNILSQISAYQQKVDAVPIREQQLADLNRDHQVSQTRYQSLLDKTYSAEMSADLERKQQAERFTVLDPAQVPEKPSKPKRKILFPAAFVFSLGICIGSVIARRTLQSSLRDEQEVKLHLPDFVPVLAVIPQVRTTQENRRHVRIRRAAVTVAMAACLLEGFVLWRIHPHL